MGNDAAQSPAHSVLILSMSGDKSRTVYSSERDIPKKNPLSGAADRQVAQSCVPIAHRRVCVRLDKKGRGGKSVTLIEGLPMASSDMDSLLKKLKSRFGTGGAVKDTVIEIQGDHRDAIMAVLESLGYRPKRAGG